MRVDGVRHVALNVIYVNRGVAEPVVDRLRPCRKVVAKIDAMAIGVYRGNDATARVKLSAHGSYPTRVDDRGDVVRIRNVLVPELDDLVRGWDSWATLLDQLAHLPKVAGTIVVVSDGRGTDRIACSIETVGREHRGDKPFTVALEDDRLRLGTAGVEVVDAPDLPLAVAGERDRVARAVLDTGQGGFAIGLDWETLARIFVELEVMPGVFTVDEVFGTIFHR